MGESPPGQASTELPHELSPHSPGPELENRHHEGVIQRAVQGQHG